MGIVFKINRDWKYIQDDVERNSIKPSRIKSFEALDYIPITDRATAQVCVIQHGKSTVYTSPTIPWALAVPVLGAVRLRNRSLTMK